MVAAHAGVLALLIALLGDGTLSAGAAPGGGPIDTAFGVAVTDAELERVAARLSDPDPRVRRDSARALAELDATAVPAIANAVDRARQAGPAVSIALADARGALGDGGTGDLNAALLALRPDPGVQQAIALTSFIGALSRASTTPAARVLITLASEFSAALRPEATRAVQSVGERAVPALLEQRTHPSVDVRAWAASQLEAMNKRIAADAVQTRQNDVLADVLRAFAVTRDPDALPVVLSFIGSDRGEVREAAREATLRYGAEALPKLREAFHNLTGKPAADGRPAGEVARDLFAASDRYRMREVYTLTQAGMADADAGRVREAVAAFDKALSRDPLFERRAEMVPVYLQHAKTIEDTDPAAALATYRKAARLAPAGAHAALAESAIAYLEAEEATRRGVLDVEGYRRALALDPTNANARAALERLEGESHERGERIRRALAAAILLLAGVVAAAVLGARRLHATR